MSHDAPVAVYWKNQVMSELSNSSINEIKCSEESIQLTNLIVSGNGHWAALCCTKSETCPFNNMELHTKDIHSDAHVCLRGIERSTGDSIFRA